MVVSSISLGDVQNYCRKNKVECNIAFYGRVLDVYQKAQMKAKLLTDDAKTLINEGKPRWLVSILAFFRLYRLINISKSEYRNITKRIEFYKAFKKDFTIAIQYCIEKEKLPEAVRAFLESMEKDPLKHD